MNKIVKFTLIAIILSPFVIVTNTVYQVQFADLEAFNGAPSECMIILGSRTLPGGVPGLMMEERLETAVEKITESTKTIIVTGGSLDEEKTEAEVMKENLVAQGVPEEKIYLENKSTSTYENLLLSKPILEQQNCETVDILSHDFHLSRAKMTAKRLDIPVNNMIATKGHEANTKTRISREHLAYLWYWLGWSWLTE